MLECGEVGAAVGRCDASTVCQPSDFRSLFLSLKNRDHAIFASHFTRVMPSNRRTASSPLAEEPVYSPTEGASLRQPREDANGRVSVGSSGVSDSVSLLFSTLSNRAEHVLCVLRSREVVVLDLTDASAGPVEVSRIPPPRASVGGAETVATAASLIPLHIAAMCQSEHSPHRSSSSNVGHESGAGYRDSRMPQLCAAPSLPRGVVGLTNGRVDIFSDVGYVFGFQAHECPVAYVAAVYSSDEVDEMAGVEEVNQPIRDASILSYRPLDSTTTEVMGSQGRPMKNLGFVTLGVDGEAFLWKPCRQSVMRPHLLVEGSRFFVRQRSICVHHPTVHDCLLGWPSASMASNVLHTTSGMWKELRMRSAVTLADVEPRLQLPGLLSGTGAVATNGELVYFSRGCSLYSVVLSTGVTACIIEADGVISNISLSSVLVLAASERGTIFILHAVTHALLARYFTRSCSPVRSLVLHGPSALMTILDDEGSVELVELPDETFKEVNQFASPADENELPSTTILRIVTKIEALAANKDALPRSARDEWEEALVMARLRVPEGVEAYLRHSYQLH